MKICVLAILSISSLAAQPRLKPSEPVQSLLDRRASVPPEIAARLTIELIRNGKIPARRQRIELLEEAWQLGGRARWPFAFTPGVTAVPTDSTLGMLLYGSAQHLDSLWLRSTAVLELANDDPALAQELFLAMSAPAPPPLSCTYPHNFDVSIYYRVALPLAAKLFTPAQARAGKRLEFLLAIVGAVSTPAQAVAAFELLRAPELPASDRAPLVNTWAGQLRSLQTDMRSFASTGEIARRLAELLPVLEKEEIAARLPVEAFRDYFLRHWSGAPCADMLGDGNSWRTRTVEFFNARLAPSAGIDPLDPKQLQPAGAGESPVNFRYWSSDRTRATLLRLKDLRLGTTEQQAEYNQQPRRKDGRAHWLPEELRRTPEWEDRMRRYLFDLENWKQDEKEPAMAWFNQRAYNYNGLAEIVPEGPMLKHVLESYVSFLKDAAAKWESPGEWLHQVNWMLAPRTDKKEPMNPLTTDIVRRSGDPALTFLLDAHPILQPNSK